MRARMARRRLSSFSVAAAACAGASAWFSAGALAVTDAAARAPRVGVLPPLWALPALVLLAVSIARLARLRDERAWPLLIPLITIAAWLPIPVPLVALLWTGPIISMVWAMTAVCVVLAGPLRIPPRVTMLFADRSRAPLAAAAIAFVLYVGAAMHLSFRVAGDEPHYLIIAESVVHDFDLRIENNHRAGQYTSYFHGELKPDFLRRGRDGQIYSVHAPGLSILVAPAFAFFGHRGVIVFIALLCAVGSALAWAAAERITSSAAAAWFGWATAALTVPFFFQAFAIYPEGIGAVAVMCGVYALLDSAAAGHRWFWYGAVLATLPWLHTRFAIPAAGLAIAIVLRLAARLDRRRLIALFLSVPLASAVAWLAFFYAIYGSINPVAPYAGNTQSAVSNIGRGLSGLLFDQQFGILPYAPVLAIAALGLASLARRDERFALEVGAVITAYALVAASFYMWWGGNSAPGRLLVAVLLPLGIPAACAFAAARSDAARIVSTLALAVSLAVTAMLLLPDKGRLIFNARDGSALWLEWIAPLVDLPRAAPSVLRDGAIHALVDAVAWIAAVAAATWGFIRATYFWQISPGRQGLLFCGLLFVAVSAAATVVWRRASVDQPTATSAQVALLRRAAALGNATGVKFSPFQRVGADAVISRLEISASGRRPVEIDSPDMTLLGLPAGLYRVRVRGTLAGTLQARVGESDVAIEQWPMIAAGRRELEERLSLPVAVTRLDVGRDPPTNDRLEVSFRPVAVYRRRSSSESSAAGRYGSFRAFLLDGSAYFEPTGLWLSAGRAAVAFDPPVPSLFVRNTTRDNVVTIEASGIAERLELRAREERTLRLPPSAETYSVVRVNVAEGVVPAMQDPASADYRNLGVWIEVR